MVLLVFTRYGWPFSEQLSNAAVMPGGVMGLMESTGRFTPALRRLVHGSYDECRCCGSRIPPKTPALAGYDADEKEAYVGPCCEVTLKERASHIYWHWHADRRCTPEQKLWRFMDFAKFVSLLEDGALFFARADKLGDPFEGAAGIRERQPVWDEFYLKFFREAVETAPSQTTLPPPEHLDKEADRLLDEMRRGAEYDLTRTFANCWHSNTVESEALWRLYCPPPHPGVAVQTTASALIESFGPDAEIELGRVQYLDFRTAFAGPYERIFSKRKSLSHEAEVRAVINNRFMRDPPAGLLLPVNLSQLVLAVIPSPFAPSWLHGLVEKTLKRYELDLPLCESELLAEPFF